ncbi:hypothetical protein AMECASPLE_015182 [Ameca splendens]|uniref:Uncharacterized protein n=1 Tax=Ameca splendens TaxID=208324 RepID=A0ABV0ZXM8_9TELE
MYKDFDLKKDRITVKQILADDSARRICILFQHEGTSPLVKGQVWVVVGACTASAKEGWVIAFGPRNADG